AAKNRGQFPVTSQGLEAAAAYMPDRQVPLDAWGCAFRYESPATTSDAPYRLRSLGRDCATGGSGPDADLTSSDL
ncbi:MAG: hypothetical protein ACI8S6_004647, partial [Myxococcota bacterium]